MNKHNKSLGNSSTNGPALNTGTKNIQSNQQIALLREKRVLATDFVANRNGGLQEMKGRLEGLKTYLSDPTRKPSSRVVKFVEKAIAQYELAVKAALGMPTFTDSVTLQHEAPKDIPTAPLAGYQLLQRVCFIKKLASSGTTAGGFFAQLIASDLADYVGSKTYYRVRKVTSWTAPRADGSYNQASFAGVEVPVSQGSAGTEVMPIWSENWTSPGSGFAGIVTQYPLGDFPQLSATDTTVIVSHFTALGGTGGVTGVPVVFHVEIECLV